MKQDKQNSSAKSSEGEARSLQECKTIDMEQLDRELDNYKHKINTTFMKEPKEPITLVEYLYRKQRRNELIYIVAALTVCGAVIWTLIRHLN